MKKITVVIGSRANYSSIKSVLHEIDDSSFLQLQLIVCASAVLDKFGSVVDLIKKDGFKPNLTINTLIEGNSPSIMAKSTGLGVIELATAFERLKPDIVITIGDRFETMSTVLAASYMNIPIAHTMGGEISGNIDESIRHAITKFAHIHFPASKSAYSRIIKLGEEKKFVKLVGCPRIDLVSQILKKKKVLNIDDLFDSGVGKKINIDSEFLLVSFHPVTSEYGESGQHMKIILNEIEKLNIPSIVLWPNSDAGTDDVSKSIRKFREQKRDYNMHFFINLPIERYVYLMSKTACLVGNSSSGIREGAFIGTPVVNIGNRQAGREIGNNVINSSYKPNSIKNSILSQIKRTRYKKNTIYGNGDAAKKIVKYLESVENINVQKKITF